MSAVRTAPPEQTTPLATTTGDRSKYSWTTQARNPVSARLYKIIGTNFDDDATKEALRTLSDLYANESAFHQGTSQDAKHDGEDTHDDDLDDDADTPFGRTVINQDHVAFESFPGEAAARARKNLRRDMELKLAEGSRQFLKVFGEVDEKLAELQKHVASMRRSCDAAEEQLRITGEASKSLLDKAESLRQERREIEARSSIVTLFLARFTLTEAELEALTSRNVPVGDSLFETMDKADRIRDDCRVLMTGEDGPTKAGLDIIATTSSQLEQGYEKLFRWCAYEFQHVGRDSTLEVGETMQEAVRRLRKRPEFLSEALSFLSQTRQATLMNSFLAALTRGGPSGLPRPIELHAHDPIRYVGDMLAWVHQAIAAELEFLESLFGLKNENRMVGSARVPHETEEQEWIRELMDMAVAKLCIPLKVRVEQTARSQGSSITSYKIANLLQFYMVTMRRTIGQAALLCMTLQQITETAYNVFYAAIDSQGRALLRTQLDPNDVSVAPPLVVLDHGQILREVMVVYQSSLIDGENEEEHVVGFQRILDSMVDPVVEMCSSVGTERRAGKQRWDQEVFVLNCLTFLQGVLEPFEFTTEKQGQIQEAINVRVGILESQHYNDLLTAAGIRDAVLTCETRKPNEPLSRILATSASELSSALHKFSVWLSGTEVVQSPRLAHLTLQRLHTQIHHAALKRLAKGYQRICEEVKRPENRYEAGSTLLGSERPFGQIHLLWQIFGLHTVER